MNRKGSNVIGLTAPTENRRMSIAKGLHSPNDGSRRASNIPPSGPMRTSLPGPSLIGLLASKRLARRLTNRLFGRKSSSRYSGYNIPVKKEPSYRMEPHKKFDPERVKTAIQDVLEGRLEKFTYRAKLCANLSKVLTDEIKDQVKLMNYDRYKIICEVHIGQKMDQGMMVTSRCAWDQKLDNFATYTFQNNHIFCTATVFGVYSE